MEKTAEEYLKEKEMLDEMFFNAYFDVSMDIKELDDLVSDKKEIIIQQEFKCYCYKNLPTDNKIFTIRGDKLTKKYVIDDLIKQGLVINCDHRFLEGFHNIKGNLYNMVLGS